MFQRCRFVSSTRFRSAFDDPRIIEKILVHRMTEWYRQGINPQGHLPYLAAYLGHRDIHSTLVYLTITQELLSPPYGG